MSDFDTLFFQAIKVNGNTVIRNYQCLIKR